MIKIRIADDEHIRVLAEIERAAAGAFNSPDLPAHLRNETVSKQEHIDAQRLGLLLAALEDYLTLEVSLSVQQVAGVKHLSRSSCYFSSGSLIP